MQKRQVKTFNNMFSKTLFIKLLDDEIFISYESLEAFENLTHNKPFPTDFNKEFHKSSIGGQNKPINLIE